MARLAGPSKARFEQLFREGLGEASGGLRVRCLPGCGLVGVAVSRSLGSQPRRNRARRRLREALRLSGELRTDADYVFVIGEGPASLPFDELRRTAEELLRRLNARCADSPSS